MTVYEISGLNIEETALIQVGEHLLAINHLKPYNSWNEFLPLIKLGVDAYRKVAQPDSIQRIGLRYINRIEFPSAAVVLEEYFEFRPYIGPKLSQDLGPFIVGIQSPYEDDRDRLKIELTSADAETQENVSFLLDIDYSLAKPGTIGLDDIIEWVDNTAHSTIENTFEACITDKLRKIFKEVQ